MTITLQLPDDLQTRLERHARQHGLSVQDWLIEAAQRSIASATAAATRITLPVANGGVPLPHQNEAWWDNIRDIAYERDGE